MRRPHNSHVKSFYTPDRTNQEGCAVNEGAFSSLYVCTWPASEATNLSRQTYRRGQPTGSNLCDPQGTSNKQCPDAAKRPHHGACVLLVHHIMPTCGHPQSSIRFTSHSISQCKMRQSSLSQVDAYSKAESRAAVSAKRDRFEVVSAWLVFVVKGLQRILLLGPRPEGTLTKGGSWLPHSPSVACCRFFVRLETVGPSSALEESSPGKTHIWFP